MAKREVEKVSSFDESARYEFPENIVRVTAGNGGEALLVLGSEKTALVDCGMAYCADNLIRNIRATFLRENMQVSWLFHIMELFPENHRKNSGVC